MSHFFLSIGFPFNWKDTTLFSRLLLTTTYIFQESTTGSSLSCWAPLRLGSMDSSGSGPSQRWGATQRKLLFMLRLETHLLGETQRGLSWGLVVESQEWVSLLVWLGRWPGESDDHYHFFVDINKKITFQQPNNMGGQNCIVMREYHNFLFPMARYINVLKVMHTCIFIYVCIIYIVYCIVLIVHF